MNAFRTVSGIALSTILLLTPGLAVGQTVRSASGVDIASITPTRDQFRTDLGGGTVAGANGSFGGLRREINWDGVPAASSAPNFLAANFFNVNSPRGVIFSTPGTGFEVSGATTDVGAGQPAAANFGNIDPSYTTTFATFSAQRLFTAVGSNVTDVTFFVPGTTTPARTKGFGAVFSDVDAANTTSIQFFDSNNVSLGTSFVPASGGSQGFSFLGVSFPTAVVSRVRITSGNASLAAGVLDGASDLVVMDDFIYGEPAASIIVNSTADVTANDGQCTFREAIIAANTNTASGAAAGECAAGVAGLDTIAFNIPGAGVKTIIPLTSLPTITQAVTIDGYTQPGSSPNTNPISAGINAVLLIEIDLENFTTIRIGAAGTTIRGLVVNRGSDKITVEADNATIAGNFIGTNPAGTAGLGGNSGGFGIRQNSGNNMTIGGPLPADRNLISGSAQGGINTDLGSSVTTTGHVIEGNYIGPDVTGTLSLSGPQTGAISGLNNAIVRGNLISGNNGGGIIAAQQTGIGPVVIQGNLIGTQRDGISSLGNGSAFGGSGVTLLSSNNTVGGTGPGEANIIAFNAGPGVGVANNTEGNRILQNSIHSNGLLGISLATQTPGTVLANDVGDADTIPGNNGQNYPVLSSTSINGGSVSISGSLNSTPSANFRLEFFSNTVCDSSGFGEGQTFLGATTVQTDGTGNVSFTNLIFPAIGGSVITSTATLIPAVGGNVVQPLGTVATPFTDTSEFSACLAVASSVADLTITKTHAGNFAQGQVGATYTITVTNSGAGATTGTVTVSDTVPAGLTPTAASGTGWSCGIAAQVVTCSRSDVLAAAASYPAITLTVNVAGSAPASVTNTATVSGGGETNTANDSASDLTTINAAAVADLTITKTHSGNFTQGQVGATYTITVTNSGAGATTGTVTVSDTVPASLTPTAASGTGWSCGIAAQVVTCSRSDVLAGSASYPAITLTVNVAGSAPASVTNIATVSGGGETNTANDSASDVTTINAVVADLTITKTHSGNFTQGQVGATYTITVTNSGAGATTGTVTVSDTVPAGLTPTAASGTGWSCGIAAQVMTCTRSDVLAGSASYPAITLTVNVAGNAPNVINTATVSGGGETNTGNDSATDATTVVGVSVPAAIIPTQSESILMLLSMLLALSGLYALQRRARG